MGKDVVEHGNTAGAVNAVTSKKRR